MFDQFSVVHCIVSCVAQKFAEQSGGFAVEVNLWGRFVLLKYDTVAYCFGE